MSNLAMNSKYEINKVYKDEFGRVSGVFLVNKPEGKTSHDIVDEFRVKFETRKVGHAGALDPFATGLLIILVGKAAKLSDSFLGLEKEYEAEIALGFKTDTLDTEGKITTVSDCKISKIDLKNTLSFFQPEYLQEVPIYSSVKVKGDKLRELVRKSDSYKLEKNEDGISTIQFIKDGTVRKELVIPRKQVHIYNLDLIELKDAKVTDYNLNDKFLMQLKDKNVNIFKSAKIIANVSKGTYIRKLAEDVGDKLGIPAMLINLKRTKIGEYSIENTFES